ncbi:MAG: LLM class flavin-dependent oxidoreductase [Nitrososphaerales archaeon]
MDLTGSALDSFKGFNFTRIWINDNLEYRSLVTVASAIAARYNVEIGSGIAVPQIRNPIDLASSMATISELNPDNSITLGMGAGSGSVTGQKLKMTNKYAIVEEMARFLRALLERNDVYRADFPTLASYFHLKADKFRLRFRPNRQLIYIMASVEPETKSRKLLQNILTE